MTYADTFLSFWNIKNEIKEAIESKGVSVPSSDIGTYASRIALIPAGVSTNTHIIQAVAEVTTIDFV